MSNINRISIRLECDIVAGTIRQYLWFVETNPFQLAAKQASVDAQIAAGEKVTGYLAASFDPSLQLAPGPSGTFPLWVNYPQTVYAFVVAESVDDEIYTRGQDFVMKFAGDGW